METVATIQQNMAHATGTMTYYRTMLSEVVYTDGVRQLARDADAYWLIDAIMSYQPEIKDGTRLSEFQLWTLNVLEDRRAILECREDSNRKPIFAQAIDYTDFPLDATRFYVEPGQVGDKAVRVILLPSEH